MGGSSVREASRGLELMVETQGLEAQGPVVPQELLALRVVGKSLPCKIDMVSDSEPGQCKTDNPVVCMRRGSLLVHMYKLNDST
jgi:hypothetical protein